MPPGPTHQSCSFRAGDGALRLLALRDGRADQIAPLGPRAVVVAHARVPQQLRQHEPGVRGALADAAVRDNLAVGCDALAAIDRTQLVGGLERAVGGIGCRGPGGALRPRNGAAALGAFLPVIYHVPKLVRVLSGRAHVYQRRSPTGELIFHLAAERADAQIWLTRGVTGGGELGHVLGVLASLGLPLGAAAVHDARVLVPVELEEPVAIGGVPVVLVTIEDDRRVILDAVTAEQRLEVLLIDEVAAHRILHVGMPVQLGRVGNVADGLVEQGIFIGLDNANLWISQVLRHPFGLDQHLRMRIPRAGRPVGGYRIGSRHTFHLSVLWRLWAARLADSAAASHALGAS